MTLPTPVDVPDTEGGTPASTLTTFAPIATAAAECPLTGTERAMIAQVVAPHLAGMTPGSVERRHARGEDSPGSC